MELAPAGLLGSVVRGPVGRDGRAGYSAALVALPAGALGVGVGSEVTFHMYSVPLGRWSEVTLYV